MTLHDLSRTIDRVSVSVEVTRTLPATLDHGRVSDSVTEDVFTIRASIQPTGTKDLQLLPEGMRNEDVVKVFTKTELFSVQRAESRVPDRFEYRGVNYQVELVDDWADLGNYFRVLAVRVDR